MLDEFREDWVFFPEIIALIDLAEKGLEAEQLRLCLVKSTAQLSDTLACFDAQTAQLTAARADIARLRDVLETFASFAPSNWVADNEPLTKGSPMAKRQVLASDFRRAACIIAETEAGQ